ncbi:MAG: zinc dependent phospholipase C family protein [Clostridia bacterium]|nr:zinc dependent phospholipase C family protein [Clostridia bacterium]
MKIRTHVKIAQIAWNACADKTRYGKYSKFAFCLGALLPDFSLTQFVHPHFYSQSHRYVFRQLERLFFEGETGKNFIYFLRLGKMAHYLSDFCCLPHTHDHLCQIRKHILYERLQNRYMIRYQKHFTGLPPCETHRIPQILQAYRKETAQIGGSFCLDIEKSIEVCQALLRACKVHQENNGVDKYRSPVSGNITTTVFPAFSGRNPY